MPEPELIVNKLVDAVLPMNRDASFGEHEIKHWLLRWVRKMDEQDRILLHDMLEKRR